MESEKVKEIKKALEYNVLDEFMNRLPYGDEFNKLKMVSFEDIITYINELERENEKWQRKAINYYQKVKSYGIECIVDNDIDETLKEFL